MDTPETPSHSNGHGGSEKGGGAHFGLGIGFGLSPELARKVREGRGMGSATLRVPDSSLTFLKRSGSGGAQSSSSSSCGTVSQTDGTVSQTDGTVSQTEGTVSLTDGTVKNSPKADKINGSFLRLEAEERSVDEGSGGEKKPPDLETPEKGDALDSWEDFDESSLSSLPSRAQATLTEKDHPGVLVGSKESNDRGGDRREAADVEEDPARVESLPMLLVDLGRVCGFRLTRTEDAEAVGERVRAVLHESFRERSEELFETGSAVHADTLSLAEELRRRSEGNQSYCWAAIDYPREVEGSSVKEAWAAVTAPSKSEAVEAVRVVLVDTNRNLIWKRDMLEQLEAIAAREREARDLREEECRRGELEAWRLRRREQLDKLIEIRPMFERRRAMAEERLMSRGNGDVRMADPVSAVVVEGLEAKLDSIDDLIARLEIEEGEDGYDDVIDGDYDDVIDGDYDDVIDGDCDDVIEAKGVNQSISAAEDDPVRPNEEENKKRVEKGNIHSMKQGDNSKKKKKKQKKGKKTPGIVERLQARGRAAAASSSGLGAMDEIKGEGRGASSTEEAPQMSLLDAVAAMILGRYPRDPGVSNEEHYNKIAAMHQHMKEAWNAEFGRLPEHPRIHPS